MASQRHERITELFLALCELPAEARAEALDEQCQGDPSLRAEIESLLERDAEQDGTFLQAPALGEGFSVQSGAAQVESDASLVGKRISHYHLERIIASGGMGTVYEAQQDEPRRTLAVKMMKRGITSKSALRRFEYEAHILAHLRHPGIAHVYEAGRYEEGGGVPYFAMELIADANPITDYAKGRKLNTRQRLDLFAKVCDAVHHGHQKGVIHRDLKPSNILVDAVSGDPKVIDFGVARATDSDIAITTLKTDVGQLIGTLQYMSPEQCEGHPHDLDTRSDVYSLGVVLYELMCDQVPYDIVSSTVPQAIRVIREETPVRPSTINRTLRGDLETITLKALEKDKTRRYESAAELASDIQRYLRNEPIIARPPSAAYQLRKFAQRHKGLAAGIAAVVTVLVAASVVSTGLYLQAERARSEAQDERKEAKRQAAIAKAVNEFLNLDLLRSVSPHEQGRNVTMREVLDEASQRIEGRFPDEPLVEAAIRITLGLTFRDLGLYQLAEPHLTEAHRLRMENLGEEDPATLAALNKLTVLYHYQSRYDKAEPLYLETLQIQKHVLGEEHAHTVATKDSLAQLYRDQGRYPAAERLYQEVLDASLRDGGEEDPETLITMNGLASLYKAQGHHEKAEVLYRRVLETRRRVLGMERPKTLSSMAALAELLSSRGRHEEAELLFEKTLKIQKHVQGPEHPDTLSTMNNLAGLYEHQGRYEKAAPLFEATLELSKQVRGDEHQYTLGAMTNLAMVYMKLERLGEAEELYHKSLEAKRSILGVRHPWTRYAMRGLAEVYEKQGRELDALLLRREWIESLTAAARIPEAAPKTLHEAARALVTVKQVELLDPVTALALATRANDLTDYKNPDFLDTLSHAYHLTGDAAKAVENQRVAISLLPPGESPLRTKLEDALSNFESALEEAPKLPAAEEADGKD